MARTTETPRGERMVKILVHLIRNKGHKYTAADIRKWLQMDEAVDIRNIQRDLKKLSEMAETCVMRENTSGKVVYFVEPDLRSHMNMPIQSNALLAMFVLKRIQPFFAPKTNTLHEMGEALSDLASDKDFDLFDDLDQKLEETTHILGEQSLLALNDDLLNNLMKALVERRVLKILYQRSDEQEPVEREVCPAKLVLFKGELYFMSISRYHANRDYFIKLCRILKAELTDEPFCVEPKRFDRIEKRLRTSFGILDEDEPCPQKVILRFPSWFDLLLNEKTFHHTQHVKRNGNGEMELSMTVPVDHELVKWVLSWEDNAQVVRPKKLRVWIGDIGRRMARRYK